MWSLELSGLFTPKSYFLALEGESVVPCFIPYSFESPGSH